MRSATVRLLATALPTSSIVVCQKDLLPTKEDKQLLRESAREDRLQAYIKGDALALYRAECHGGQERSRACAAARDLIEARSHALMHPPAATAHSLKHYHLRHGCTRCTPAAADAAAAAVARTKASRVVEVGAGRATGRRRRRLGADNILAFDDGSAVPSAGAPDVFPVVRGDAADAVAVADALLLVYPPPTPMARAPAAAAGASCSTRASPAAAPTATRSSSTSSRPTFS
ncbi:hypothetical protein JL720_1052 [Aureococcus anophagefferens]|nr:hypothetical protein JL720_1052 [Aureococcus anophagefferens]